MKNILSKLLSRKFWLSVAGVTTGIAMILGVTESEISTVAGAILALGSVASYIMVEGQIDLNRLKNAAEKYIDGGKEDGN